MGYSRWDPKEWKGFATKTKSRTTAEVFTSSKLIPELDPKGVKVRESRDSKANPESTAIIVGVDVTGSMGMLADALVREGLGVLIEELLERKPVADPHTMIMGIGDPAFDSAPLQVSQFEADNVLCKQLTNIWLEKGGGGNSFEGYDLPWYFAANHTSIDCFEKRGKKGYLFTVGDEEPSPRLLAKHVKAVFGDKMQSDIDARDLLALVSRTYNVFHLIVEEGDYASRKPVEVKQLWADLLGQRAVSLSDHKKMAEVIVATIEVTEGRDRDEVIGSWKGSAKIAVRCAVKDLVPGGSGRTGAVARL